jgi:hypothetical protein
LSDAHAAKFHPETGRVRLEHASSTQIVFRLTAEGIVVWSKRAKREVLIPWPLLLGWKEAISS